MLNGVIGTLPRKRRYTVQYEEVVSDSKDGSQDKFSNVKARYRHLYDLVKQAQVHLRVLTKGRLGSKGHRRGDVAYVDYRAGRRALGSIGA